MKLKKRPMLLMILDGFGLSNKKKGNAIAQANTPYLDSLFEKYPHTKLKASGQAVGLPEGQMGNSEVGHLNIGAGRIVYQELSRITKACEDNTILLNPELNAVMNYVLENGTALHLLGLVSDGGVHSHIDHLKAILTMAKDKGITRAYIHCFMDGRDVPPTSGINYIKELQNFIEELGLGEIVTIAGRYYAMDRDKRWDRVQKAFEAMVMREGRQGGDPVLVMEEAYANGETDEFVLPTCIHSSVASDTRRLAVNDRDGLIMFNFRPDRAREITRAFVDPNFDGFTRRREPQEIKYVCMTQYDAEMPNVAVAFPPDAPENTFGEYISSLGLTQLRIAETEKYAHVTFFFNGGREEPFKGEDRILVPSPKVATYDLQPHMSAFEVTEQLLIALRSDKYDVIILNFANPDMVGHTGVMSAAIKAIEAIDKCIPNIVASVLAKGGQLLLTADHGNADVMIDEDGNPVTAHSLNPVPLMHISSEPRKLKRGGRLCDIAPTMLELMGLEKPEEMTGKSLLK